ncbi:MAG TPA: oligosaccharide flippase family protein [Anaerolineales bacterium]|nr:oligosaccharide flippase family protein [Anaerolineales bacterium]
MRELVWDRFVGANRYRVLRQTAVLFLVDLAANLVDYAYHVYLGRTLVPGDFGVFQTVNSALLIAITAAGVLQPVVARFVAEEEARRDGPNAGSLTAESATYVRASLGWSALAGVCLSAAVWLGRGFISTSLNVPEVAVQLGAVLLLTVLLRPVIAGVLQGAQRFVAYGAVRLAFALGRFAVAALLFYWGWGLLGAVVSLPAGQLLAVGFGLAAIGPSLLAKSGGAGRFFILDWLPLAGWAFVSYGAHAALINMDLLFVSGNFSSDAAGIYAAGVLLRRILLLLPAAAVIVMYPRIAAAVAQKTLPDLEIRWGAGLVSAVMVVLVGIYFAAGEPIVRLVFGEAYAGAGPSLGWMGLGIWGYALGTVWMNVYLATRPGPFAGFLLAAVALQAAGLLVFGDSPSGVVAVFTAAGWLLALGGGILYLAWLRPRLIRQFQSGADE